MYRTTEDIDLDLWGASVTIPRGTAIKKSPCGFFVESIRLLIKLTGNTHDPIYRYAWVPEAFVEAVN